MPTTLSASFISVRRNSLRWTTRKGLSSLRLSTLCLTTASGMSATMSAGKDERGDAVMATVVQVMKLYEKILELLKPLGRIDRNAYGRLGGTGLGVLTEFGDFGLDNTRSDNGRFFYTGLGSGQPDGGYVRVDSEKIRGDVFTRNAGGVLGVGGLRAVDGVGGVWDTLSAWNVGNDSIWGMDSASKALNNVNAISVNAASKQNAWEYRLGEGLEKQLNGKQILGTNGLASIDRSWENTGRGFSVMGRIGELSGEQNAVSQRIKTGETWGTQSAVSQNNRLSGMGRRQSAVSQKRTAANAAICEFAGSDARESGGAASTENAGGCDADTLIDMLCGAFREAAFSMSEGVHY